MCLYVHMYMYTLVYSYVYIHMCVHMYMYRHIFGIYENLNVMHQLSTWLFDSKIICVHYLLDNTYMEREH